MAYGEADQLDQDYYGVKIDELQIAQQEAIQSASFSITGASTGQIAVFNGTAYAPGTLTSGDGIGAALTSSPFGIQFSVTNAATLRTKLGLGINAITEIPTTSVNPGSIGANSTGTVDMTVTGIAVGDVVMLNRPAGLDDDLVFSGCRVQTVDTVRLFLYNPTAAPIDDGANDWQGFWMDKT